MKRFLFSLAVFFSALLFMLSPVGTTKVKAAGEKIGTVDWSTISSGSHNGDYIVSTTTINNVPQQHSFYFAMDAPGKTDYAGGSYQVNSSIGFTDINEIFNTTNNNHPDYFNQSLQYNAFEIKYEHNDLFLTRVYVAPDPTPTPTPAATSVKTGTLCSHDYEWETEIEPTDNEDGEEQLKCTKCGNIIQRQTISAYPTYIESCMKKISDAKDGGTVTITSHKWNSYPKSVFDAIAGKNITITIEYPDELHHMYTYTVTSEQAKNITDDYAGPETMKVLGATELVK